MAEGSHTRRMLSHRVQGLAVIGIVFVVVVVVLTVVQAAKHDWFIFNAASSAVGGTVRDTEWGMVGLGIIIGAAFALVLGFVFHLLSEYWHKGQPQFTSGHSADIESGKDKFLAAQHSPAERDYVARYGQKAYRTASGVQVGSMPQPLTPGHTAMVKIKALTEQEAAGPGRAWSLGRLLSFSWDPAARAQAGQQLEHAPTSRFGTANLAKTGSSSSSIEPVVDEKIPTMRALTFSEMAHQISSPFGFLRAGSAQPVAYDNDGESDSEGNHERHQAGEAGGSQHKGPAGLMGQVYNRKLEQAQQAVQAKLTGVQGASGGGVPHSPNPRILVLRESGDVEVNVDLGDRENTPDGSFVRTVTHRHISTGSDDEHKDEGAHKAKSKGDSETAHEQQDKSAMRDGHAPEVVPADGDTKASKTKPIRSAMKKSKSHGKFKAASEKSQRPSEAKTRGQAGGQVEGAAGSSHRKSASPVFLSPSESLNSNSSTALSSGRSTSLGQHGRENDSFADAAAAALAASSQSVKPVSADATSQNDASASTQLSSAALKSLDDPKRNKASNRASAKSHSRSSSVAEWDDVELQSEAEDEAHHDKESHQSGRPPVKGHAADIAALAASDSDNDSELGIEGVQHDQHVSASSVMTAHGHSGSSMLRTIPLEALPREAGVVRMVVCISLEEILPRPKAGLLSRMLRLADVTLVTSPDTMEPLYLLHPGGEYHIGVSLFHPPAGQRLPVGGVAWVRVAVGDGQAVTMDVEQDEEMEGGEWSGRATWLTSKHESQALATVLSEGSQEQAPVLPLDVTIGFKPSESAGHSPGKRRSKHRSSSHRQQLVLSTTMGVKVVTRRTDAQASHSSTSEYRPPASLLDFWSKWNNSLEDIEDCTVVCVK